MARFETVVAVRVPTSVERELRRRAVEDDRTLSAYVRRQLVAMTANTAVADDNLPEDDHADDQR